MDAMGEALKKRKMKSWNDWRAKAENIPVRQDAYGDAQKGAKEQGSSVLSKIFGKKVG
ncbi:hypothetical protein [Microcystis sp. M061S2]|uniref:hypothetical protein n=1 Tax=Microcystis sp. M061S2 TaxID=2771171 RepID=UPI00258A7AB0|nr:hypothetical protein [Microcystis sp. M061S2]